MGRQACDGGVQSIAGGRRELIEDLGWLDVNEERTQRPFDGRGASPDASQIGQAPSSIGHGRLRTETRVPRSRLLDGFLAMASAPVRSGCLEPHPSPLWPARPLAMQLR